MKKVTILLTTMLIASIAFMSFKTKNAKYYGGSASVKVKVGTSDYTCTINKTLDKAKDGDTRIIEVTTSCLNRDIAAAKDDLKNKIKYEMKCYEAYSNSIDYDINGCD